MTRAKHATTLVLAKQTGRRAGDITRTGPHEKANRPGISTPTQC